MAITKLVVVFLALAVCGTLAQSNPWLVNFVQSSMNTSVNPCEDFYTYSCGNWISSHTIPPDRGQIDRAFTSIDENNEQVLYQVLQDPATDRKLLDLYSSCMNMTAITDEGLYPLVPFLDAVSSLMGDPEDLFDLVATLHSYGINAFWSFGVSIDPGAPTQNIASLGQGGLSLPDVSYYLDADSADVRTAYAKHISNMFQLVGFDQASAGSSASAVLFIETQLAKISFSPDELTDPFETYNPMNIGKLTSISPLPWKIYLNGLGAPQGLDKLTLDVPTFFGNLTNIIVNTGAYWVPYLQWHVVHDYVSTLPQAFIDEDFNFFGKVLRGLEKQSARQRVCIRAVDSYLGELLGTYFAKIAFPGQSKKVAQDMINSIEQAMHDNLETITWMDNVTQSQALLKLSQIINMIGYSDHPTNYSFPINPTTYADNVILSNAFSFRNTISKLSEPADRMEWEMTPATVNAYYDPTKNEMVFPAGILQTPYFNLTFPQPMIFGGAGMIMGHELTHGFDNQGKDYTGTGLLTDWWQPETEERFNQKVQCIINQYSKFEVLPGLYVNGKLTQGENIADCGGIKLSYHAYSQAAGASASQPSIIPGLTNAQLYFVGFAQGWCNKATPQQTRVRILTDPHSPPRFRVLGPLMNLPEFSQVFNCPANSPMNPNDRCVIW